MPPASVPSRRRHRRHDPLRSLIELFDLLEEYSKGRTGLALILRAYDDKSSLPKEPLASLRRSPLNTGIPAGQTALITTDPEHPKPWARQAFRAH